MASSIHDLGDGSCSGQNLVEADDDSVYHLRLAEEALIRSPKSALFSQNPDSTNMSQVPSDTSAIIAALQAELIPVYTTTCMIALVTYEYIITLNKEMTMIWGRRWTSVTWLFIANRYSMVALTITSILPTTSQVNTPRDTQDFTYILLGHSCRSVTILGNIFSLLQYSVFAAFSALRVYSIWDRNILITILVLVLGLVPLAVNSYSYHYGTITFAVDPLLGSYCSNVLSIPASTIFDLALGTRLALVISDILVLALTWRKTFRHRIDALRLGMQTPLSTLLLRDGTIYFGALLVLNIARVLVNIVPSLQNVSPIIGITQILTPILISRYLLNLRQLGEPKNDTPSHFDSQFSIPNFRVPTLNSVIEPMGADLDYTPTEELDELDDERGEAHIGVVDTATEVMEENVGSTLSS